MQSQLATSAAAPPRSAVGVTPAQLVVWTFLGTVTMLFAAFVSAYLIRRTGSDWVAVELPRLLWANTAALLLSSVTLEIARTRRDAGATSVWLGATALLGALFLAGQVAAWRQLAAGGVLVATSPHSSFLYILTGYHGLHLAGGLVALVPVLRRARRLRPGPVSPALAGRLQLTANYWHFMGGLWVFLLLVLSRL